MGRDRPAPKGTRICEHYIVEQNFKFLMLSRLSQYALKNLSSTIRLKTPIPRARELKSTFRVIVLAQFSQPSRNSSYAIDDSHDLLSFLTEKKELLKESTTDDVIETSFESVFELCQEEEDSLEYCAGIIIAAMGKNRTRTTSTTGGDRCTTPIDDE
ncbi:hypothetical protein HPB50_007716 [Hyalomma asiaticum]|uniref:Uncharacterized protein n=1 Tax=Hyalomma asiaticum TaxID=266040 RepID=A0ACB7RZ18_HYAAI|nr:hypothetical protein HPB50_007716 [Hyalomma asiaticum]